MKKLKDNLSVQMIVTVVVLLLAVNLLLGIRLVSQSKSAMQNLIRNRMLDIANTAADMLDGDALGTLTAADRGTPRYQAINDALAVFQENIDLEYIYTIRDEGDGKFSFMVDPTVEDPGEFGDPIVYTDALHRASLGTPAVDAEPYTDAWGRFYSAYSPVLDSRGRVAGIVAVDFSAQWYDEQLSRQTRSIVLNSLLTVLFGIALVLVATRRLRRELQSINADIGALSRDVNDLTREIRSGGGQTEFQPSEDVRALSGNIHAIKEELSRYVNSLESQANSMVTALASDYRSVYYVDLDRDEGVCYQALADYDGGLGAGERFAYREVMERYARDCVTEPYYETFLRFVEPDTVREGLKNQRLISLLYTVRRGGAEFYETVRFAGVRRPEDRDDHTVHAVGMGFTDVDAETRKAMARSDALRDALTAAEAANRAKTAFLSNMSHEIRTPMNAIIGLDSIALTDPAISGSTREHLEKIGLSARHLLGIINDILDMSRIESGRMTLKQEEFSFTETLEQINTIIGGQCRDKGLRYGCRVAGPVGEYYVGDDMKLRQVMINILGNAVKFTPEGGAVTFSVEPVAQYQGRTTLRFLIRDTGIGMSRDYLPKIFDAFSQEDSSSTNKYGSTGLGMPITKSLVELMNGTIEVDSEKGRGTAFTVTLTLQNSDRHDGGSTAPSAAEAPAAELSGRRVLLAEDVEVNAEIIIALLDMRDMTAEHAVNGRVAVEMFSASAPGYYDAILMDMRMPEMDGLTATRTIRGLDRPDAATVPIIALTANAFDEDVQRSMQAGLNAHLSKPVEPEALFASLEKLLDR